MNNASRPAHTPGEAARPRLWFAPSALLRSQSPIARPAALVMSALTLTLLVINVALVRQNARLTAAVDRASRAYLPVVGSTVPPLLGVDLNGVTRTVGYGEDAKDTLLFVFSPTCFASTSAWPRWVELAREADKRSVRIVYANIGPTVPPRHPVRDGGLDPATVLQTDARSLVSYNLQVTPQIVRITPEGRIVDVWVGTLDSSEEIALRRALGIHRAAALSSAHR